MLSVRQELTFRLLEALVKDGKINPIGLSDDKIKEVEIIKSLQTTVDVFLQYTKEPFSDGGISLGKYLSEIHLVLVDAVNLLEGKVKHPLSLSFTNPSISDDILKANNLANYGLAVLENSRIVEEESCLTQLTGISPQLRMLSNDLREAGLRLLSLSQEFRTNQQPEVKPQSDEDSEEGNR